MNTYNSIESIDIDKLESIDREREKTLSDPEFQQWCIDMKIGARVQKREAIDRANDMMRLWTTQAEIEETSWMPDFIRRMY